MLAIDAGVLAAWILGAATLAAALVGGPVMWGLKKLERRNDSQHDDNATKQALILAKLDEVATDAREAKEGAVRNGAMISEHIAWHAHDRAS